MLTVREAFQLACVCKAWRALLNQPVTWRGLEIELFVECPDAELMIFFTDCESK